jgi:hypothetical protein
LFHATSHMHLNPSSWLNPWRFCGKLGVNEVFFTSIDSDDLHHRASWIQASRRLENSEHFFLSLLKWQLLHYTVIGFILHFRWFLIFILTSQSFALALRYLLVITTSTDLSEHGMASPAFILCDNFRTSLFCTPAFQRLRRYNATSHFQENQFIPAYQHMFIISSDITL